MATTPEPIQILEAGCGRAWTVPLEGIRYRLTGLDMDPEALRARVESVGDLDEAIVGDLRTATLPEGRFDVIFCAYVLEHVPDPIVVLENFRRWLQPHGLIIIRVPDPDSVYGFLARITPHWFHVAIYRYVFGNPNAGKPGFAPYPTHYDRLISFRGMAAFCETNDLYLREAVAHYQFGRSMRSRALTWMTSILGRLSLGRLSGDHNNLTFIIERRSP